MSHQTLTFLKQRFEQVGLKLQSRHGQNFLIDLNLLRILADSAQLSPDDVVLEVGTGVGSLTALVAPQVAQVVTVEIDPRLAQLASEELIQLPNVTLLQMDALRKKHQIEPVVLAAVQQNLDAAPNRRFKLVANLPYGVATPLISNLLELDRPPQSMTITIQKELAERLAAQPCTKDYSALSIWVQVAMPCRNFANYAAGRVLAAAEGRFRHSANRYLSRSAAMLFPTGNSFTSLSRLVVFASAKILAGACYSPHTRTASRNLKSTRF